MIITTAILVALGLLLAVHSRYPLESDDPDVAQSLQRAAASFIGMVVMLAASQFFPKLYWWTFPAFQLCLLLLIGIVIELTTETKGKVFIRKTVSQLGKAAAIILLVLISLA